MHRLLNFVEKLPLGTQLRWGVGMLLGIAFLLGAQSIYSARSQAQQIRRVYEIDLLGVSHIKEANVHLMEVGRALRQMMLAPNAAERSEAKRTFESARDELLLNIESSKSHVVQHENQHLLLATQNMVARYLQMVMVTAFGADEARIAGSMPGVSAFLDKPVSQSRLWDTLSGMIYPESVPLGAVALQAVNTGQLAGFSVLLVEDNEINQQIARELMEFMGVHVTLASNGQQALDLLQTAKLPLPWSLVLMDLQMPVMDGHQATLAIRQQDRFKDLPIIALTAHAANHESERCRAEGMNAHLTKPIDPETLYRCLAYWGKSVSNLDGDLPANNDAKLPVTPVQPASNATNNVAVQMVSIPGVDVVNGLRLCAGNQRLYAGLLARFLNDICHLPGQLHDALAHWEFARRPIHSLRGVAANVGAAQCSALCADLEQALDEAMAQSLPASDPAELVAQLLEHLTQLEPNLRLALVTDPVLSAEGSGSGPLDTAQLHQVIEQLADLLQADNAEAELLLQSQTPLLRTGLGSQVFDLLARQVHDFDFSDALITLNLDSSVDRLLSSLNRYEN